MIASPLLIRKRALTSESDSLSEIPRALIRMIFVPSNAALYIVIEIPIVLKYFSRLSLIVHRAPIMTGITVALMLHYLCI